MRNHVLNVGVAIIAFSSLPSCTTDPASEASEVSDVGLAENVASLSEQVGEPSSDIHALGVKSTEKSSSNEDVRGDFIEDNAMALTCSISWFTYNDGHCYQVTSACDHVIRVQVVKFSGSTTSCFSIPPGGTLNDCLASGRVAKLRFC
jgi:hypothetical protein